MNTALIEQLIVQIQEKSACLTEPKSFDIDNRNMIVI